MQVSRIDVKKNRLNPCFSGTYPRRLKLYKMLPDFVGLNPCFSGTYPRSRILKKNKGVRVKS